MAILQDKQRHNILTRKFKKNFPSRKTLVFGGLSTAGSSCVNVTGLSRWPLETDDYSLTTYALDDTRMSSGEHSHRAGVEL
jgi:hypothetical protein